MLVLRTGQPGAGKTLTAVKENLLRELRDGRRITTNIPLRLDALEVMFPGCRALVDIRVPRMTTKGLLIPYSTVDDLNDAFKVREDGTPDLDDRGRGVYGLIDECQVPFPSSGTPFEIIIWMTLHRKIGADIELITQQPKQMNSKLIELPELHIHLWTLKHVFGERFGSDRAKRTVRAGHKGPLTGTSYVKHDPAIWPLYKSTYDGVVLAGKSGSNPFLGPRMVFFYVVILSIIVWNTYNGGFSRQYGYFTGHLPGTDQAKPPSVVNGEVQPPMPPQEVATSVVESKKDPKDDKINNMVNSFLPPVARRPEKEEVAPTMPGVKIIAWMHSDRGCRVVSGQDNLRGGFDLFKQSFPDATLTYDKSDDACVIEYTFGKSPDGKDRKFRMTSTGS